MHCKNCGTQNSEGYAYCSRCGLGPGMGASFCAHCGASIGYGMTACPACGTPAGAQPGHVGYIPKSRLAAGLLGIFFGMFGVHNFYLGNTGKAIAQLLISVLSCCILSPISAIWGFIEGIMILTDNITTDGRGLPLGE